MIPQNARSAPHHPPARLARAATDGACPGEGRESGRGPGRSVAGKQDLNTELASGRGHTAIAENDAERSPGRGAGYFHGGKQGRRYGGHGEATGRQPAALPQDEGHPGRAQTEATRAAPVIHRRCPRPRWRGHQDGAIRKAIRAKRQPSLLGGRYVGLKVGKGWKPAVGRSPDVTFSCCTGSGPVRRAPGSRRQSAKS